MLMPHTPVGDGLLSLSRVVLGGHEYLPDGRSRAFNEDLAKAVTPGHLFPGFGGPLRQAVVTQAAALGITTFDVTIDSEKEALGRNLQEAGLTRAVIQTRPEGMVYGYDPGNRRMIIAGVLEAEVRRLLRLLRQERLDILNLGVLSDAFYATPDFAARLGDVVHQLKHKRLIRCAAADTFSGGAAYSALLATTAFDTLNLNFNIADDGALTALIPEAVSRGVCVVVREVFMKGELFRIARDEHLGSDALVASAAAKWVARQPGIAALIAGARSAGELTSFASAVQTPSTTPEEDAALERLLDSPRLLALRDRNRAHFHQALAAT